MFGEMVPSGSSKRTSMRESAAREPAGEAQPIFGANKSEAAPVAPCCKKSRRLIISVSSVAEANPIGSQCAIGKSSRRSQVERTIRLSALTLQGSQEGKTRLRLFCTKEI